MADLFDDFAVRHRDLNSGAVPTEDFNDLPGDDRPNHVLDELNTVVVAVRYSAPCPCSIRCHTGTHKEVAMEPSGQRTQGSASTLTLIGTMVVQPEHEAEFLDVAQATINKVIEHEPGVLLYTLHRHPTEAHTYLWVERYADADALTAHSEAPYIAEAMSKLPGWLARAPEIQQYKQIAPK